MAKEAYKGHRPGSIKGDVHKVYDAKGVEAAVKKAVALGATAGSARTWCSFWKNNPGESTYHAPAKKSSKPRPTDRRKVTGKKAAAKSARKAPAKPARKRAVLAAPKPARKRAKL